MGDTPLHPPHSQSRPLRKAAGPYPMAWVLLFTAAGVAVARYATLPAGFLAAAFAAATLMAFITYRRRIGNGYIAIALLLLGMALPALRPQPAYGPAGTNRLHEAASERIRRLHLPPDAEAVALAMAAGDQTELTPERRAPYARTGTAHVLAVSGLHVGRVFLEDVDACVARRRGQRQLQGREHHGGADRAGRQPPYCFGQIPLVGLAVNPPVILLTYGVSGYRCCGWRSPGRPFRSSSVRCSKGCCGCKTGWSPKRPPCPVPRSTTG